MRHHVLPWALLLGLGACAADDGPVRATAGPERTCQQQEGVGAGEPFDECIERLIAERCALAGHPAGSPAAAACAEQFRRTIFTARQMELRGFRPFTEVN